MTTKQLFYSVETPSVFRELALPADDSEWTPKQERQYERLAALAERHGTHVTVTTYRRG